MKEQYIINGVVIKIELVSDFETNKSFITISKTNRPYADVQEYDTTWAGDTAYYQIIRTLNALTNNVIKDTK